MDFCDASKRITDSLEINEKFNFISDFLNKKSIIQCLFENKKIKEITFLVDFMIKSNDDFLYAKILI
jgi:hypothetical protein